MRQVGPGMIVLLQAGGLQVDLEARLLAAAVLTIQGLSIDYWLKKFLEHFDRF